MSRAHGRRGVVGRGVLACVLLAWCPSAFALNPALDVSQYAHTAWKIREGFTKGAIVAIAQTPDGYLWLGTEFGLLRFDGVRNVPWQPPPGVRLPSDSVTNLLAARDGTLWIGTDSGLASWKDGTLTLYQELAGSHVGHLLEDREGSIWMPRFVSGWSLCAIQKSRVQCYGEDGGPGAGAQGLYEDSRGTLWVGTDAGLWRWKPGPPRFYSLPPQPNGIQQLSEGDSALLIAMSGGISRFVDGEANLTYPFPPSLRHLDARKMLTDRDGGLWVGTGGGLIHVHRGITDVFAQPDGLSGDSVSTILQDNEGSVWVATTGGLDRFRDAAAAPFTPSQGLSNSTVEAVLAAVDGSVWLTTPDGLNRWGDGHVTVYRERSEQARLERPRVLRNNNTHEVSVGGFAADHLSSIFQDGIGRVWVATGRGVGYLEHDRYVPVSGIPGGLTRAIVEDGQAGLWFANLDRGLFRLSRGRSDVDQIPWTRLNHKDPASALAADPSRGGLWLGFRQGGIAYFDGQLRASYSAADGLGAGRVSGLQLDRDGTLWVSTDSGLSRLKDGRLATLTGKNGLPCDGVQWTIEDDQRSLWLGMKCGVVRIVRAEIAAWAAAADDGKGAEQRVHATLFDHADGVRLYVNVSYYSAPVARSSDGKLWFMSQDGVSVIDPHHLPFNSLPPPVHIEQITADRKLHDATSGANSHVRLPPLVRDLQIDYTALSLVAPEKNHFRVKLEGWDREWQDVGNRRQAFYNNLPPRRYRFRVIASNNSGVWNETGASLDLAIAPAYYQTTWFRALIAMAGLTLLWAAYQYRLRRIAHEFDLRLDERVNERTRVARELHDTLLQTFHGVLFRFQAATNMLPERPAEAKQKFESAIDRAAQAITEGRDAIQDLRASTVVTNDLAVAISTLGDELAASGVNGNRTVVDVSVQGTPRDLHPILRDDIYRIAGEALRNAVRHAHAHRIEAEITYDDRQFRLQVRDDGKGMDPALVADQRRGHFGLPGMRERAELIGGRLDVWSGVGAGTEIDLTIPAAKAYAAARTRRRAWWLAKGMGTGA